MPWASEIKSFAYYAKPASSRCAPDSQVTLNPLSNSPAPSSETALSETCPSSQITLIFSHSEDGIVIKTDKADHSKSGDTDNILSPSRISLVNSEDPRYSNAIKSTNIWSNIQTTITSSLESSLGKSIFSKMNDIRNPSSSGESSSKDNESLTCKRDTATSSDNSPPKIPRTERRNIWDTWCPTSRPGVEQVSPPDPSTIRNSREQSDPVVNSSDLSNSSAEIDANECPSSNTFDQKSFLLNARSSTADNSATLRPQPLTRKLEKLSRHKRPVLVCTNSSPRPSDDSQESSPAIT